MPSLRTGTRPTPTTLAIGSGTMAGGSNDISHGSHTFHAAVRTRGTLSDSDVRRLIVLLAETMDTAVDIV